MKKILVMMLVLIGVSTGTMAQNEEKECCGQKQDKPEIIKRRTEWFVERYGLDRSQAERLLVLNTKYAGKMPHLHRSHAKGYTGKGFGGCCKTRLLKGDSLSSSVGGRNLENRRKEAKVNREAYRKELKKILTQEQYAKCEADRKKYMDRKESKNGK